MRCIPSRHSEEGFLTGADVASLLGSWDPDWLAVVLEEKDKDVPSTSTNASEEFAECAVATCLGAAASR